MIARLLIVLAGLSMTVAADMSSASSAVASEKLGTFSGRFLYDGKPPVPKDLYPELAKVEADLPLPRDDAGRVLGLAELYRHYLRADIRPRTVDQSLLVGEDGGIANIIMWVASKNIPLPPQSGELPAVTLRVRNGNFSPRVTTLFRGQELVVENHDPLAFHLNVLPGRNVGINALLQPNSIEHPFRTTLPNAERLPIPFNCCLCPWASGVLFVHTNPFIAVTDASGSFTLPQLPPGTWEFRAWHERCGYIRHWPKRLFQQTIQPGANRLGTIKLKPEDFGIDTATTLESSRTRESSDRSLTTSATSTLPARREQIGEVLGQPVYRDQIDDNNVQRVFFMPVRAKYTAAHRTEMTPTVAEIDYARTYFERQLRARLEADGGETKIQQQIEVLRAKLSAGGLGDADEQTLDNELSALISQLDIKPRAVLLANMSLANWKSEKHLYEAFGGGRVLIGKFGHSAFDATRRFMETAEKQGDFQITDPTLRTKFYEPWTRDRGSFVTDDKEQVRQLLLEPEYVAPANGVDRGEQEGQRKHSDGVQLIE